MLIPVLLLVLGLVVLIFSGDFLVKGAVGIAQKFDISPLVIGMTVVSFGTSAPELFVSVGAAMDGVPELAIGNVVGSNIANIALVLAITVLIFPIVVDKNSKIIDWPMMMGSTVLFYLFALDNEIQRWEGIVLVAIIVLFIIFIIRKSRRDKTPPSEEEVEAPSKQWLTYVFLLGGLVGLKFGAEWMLEGAIGIAEQSGMSKEIIGVTIIAIGTSVPELVASGVAAYRKQTDISIGNLIGSNIFNIMVVIGITAIIKPITITNNQLSFDFVWMIAVAVILFPLLVLGKKMGRGAGVILISLYTAFIILCVLKVINQYDDFYNWLMNLLPF